MKIRNYLVVNCGSVIITAKKDESHYKSTYSVSLFAKSGVQNSKTTCPNRASAKKEVTRLLKLYTDLTLTQISKIK